MDTITKPSPHADDTERGREDAFAATQTFETPGIKPMGRPSFTTRAVMRVVSWIERLNLRSAKFGNPPVYDLDTFPWARELERKWQMWMYAYVAGMPPADHEMSMPMDMPMPK